MSVRVTSQSQDQQQSVDDERQTSDDLTAATGATNAEVAELAQWVRERRAQATEQAAPDAEMDPTSAPQTTGPGWPLVAGPPSPEVAAALATAPAEALGGYSPQELEAALVAANTSLYDWINNRSRGLRNLSVILGPNIDGTYYYRLGSRGTHGYGMQPDELEEAETNLVAQGFPVLNEEELDLVNSTGYQARQEALPDTRIVAKHFPGGDPLLETTEEVAVSYDNAAQIREWTDDFRRLVHSRMPPDIIMVGHASYAAEGFDGIEDTDVGPALEGYDFDEVPASFNPALVRYLREQVGHEGLVMSDWYEMGSIETFVQDYDPGYEVLDAGTSGASGWVSFVLAVHADIDFIGGIFPSLYDYQEQLDLYMEAKPEEAALFLEKLDSGLERMWTTFDNPEGVSLNLSLLNITDKFLMRTYNGKQGDMRRAYQEHFLDRPESVQQISRVFSAAPNQTGDYDIWNRTGVMTLYQRQRVVEELTGRSFGPPPANVGAEDGWFDNLMANAEFRRVYDSIDWTSPMYTTVVHSVQAQRDEALGVPDGIELE